MLDNQYTGAKFECFEILKDRVYEDNLKDYIIKLCLYKNLDKNFIENMMALCKVDGYIKETEFDISLYDKNNISNVCDDLISSYDCNKYCVLCKFSEHYKNEDLHEEKNILTYALKSEKNFKDLLDADITSDSFQSFIKIKNIILPLYKEIFVCAQNKLDSLKEILLSTLSIAYNLNDEELDIISKILDDILHSNCNEGIFRDSVAKLLGSYIADPKKSNITTIFNNNEDSSFGDFSWLTPNSSEESSCISIQANIEEDNSENIQGQVTLLEFPTENNNNTTDKKKDNLIKEKINSKKRADNNMEGQIAITNLYDTLLNPDAVHDHLIKQAEEIIDFTAKDTTGETSKDINNDLNNTISNEIDNFSKDINQDKPQKKEKLEKVIEDEEENKKNEQCSTEEISINVDFPNIVNIYNYDLFQTVYLNIINSKMLFLEYLPNTDELILFLEDMPNTLYVLDLSNKEIINSLFFPFIEKDVIKISFDTPLLINRLLKQNILIKNYFSIQTAYSVLNYNNKHKSKEDIVKELTGLVVPENLNHKDFSCLVINKYKSIHKAFVSKLFSSTTIQQFETESAFNILLGESYYGLTKVAVKDEKNAAFKLTSHFNYSFNFNLKSTNTLHDNGFFIKASYMNLDDYLNSLDTSLHSPLNYEYSKETEKKDVIIRFTKELYRKICIQLVIKNFVAKYNILLLNLSTESIIFYCDRVSYRAFFDILNQSMDVLAKEIYLEYKPEINISTLTE